MHLRIAYFTPVLAMVALALLGRSVRPPHAEAQVLLPPTIVKSFQILPPLTSPPGTVATTVPLGTPNVVVFFRLTNPNVATPITASFTDDLPNGMLVAGAP